MRRRNTIKKMPKPNHVSEIERIIMKYLYIQSLKHYTKPIAAAVNGTMHVKCDAINSIQFEIIRIKMTLNRYVQYN